MIDIDCDDLPEIFVRALYGFGPEVRMWSRSDALREAEQKNRPRNRRERSDRPNDKAREPGSEAP